MSSIEPSSLSKDPDVVPAARPPFRLRQFNRKISAPSLRMHPSDGQHYRCPWIEDSITVHSDGNVTCGLDDPHGQRSFGNINSQPIEEIFRNPEYENLRSKLWNGHRCTDCSLYDRETAEFNAGSRIRPSLPTTLVVEPTVKCNIKCLNDACHANNDASIRTRDADMLNYDAFAFMIDQIKDGLKHVYFFNYGDPFVHAQAEDMLLYLRQSSAGVQIVTSTNGIPLAKPGRAEKIVQSAVDTIVFTIAGVTQEAYARYHVGGKVVPALQGLKNVLDAKRKLENTRTVVVWRYLLFNWNDSLAEVDEAIRMAHEFGVSGFHLYLTHVPQGAASFRFAPGTPNFARYRHFMDCALGYTREAGIVEPDADGLFPLEEVQALGPARWTGYRARLRLDGSAGWLKLAFATKRQAARERPATVFVLTPWSICKLSVEFDVWRPLSIRVPKEWRDSPVKITVVTPDYWFPAEELGSHDKRCLGVLIRTGDAVAGRAGLRAMFGLDVGQDITEDDRTIMAGLGVDAEPAKPLSDRTVGGRMVFNNDGS